MDDLHMSGLIEYCANARLIVVADTLSRIHKLDENSNSEMAHLIATFEHVEAITGAAVLYLHHVIKASVHDGQSGQNSMQSGELQLVIDCK